MRTPLNSAASYLRQMKDAIPDTMLKSILIDGDITIELAFPTTGDLVNFGHVHLRESSVECVTFEPPLYKSFIKFRKRPITILMSVDRSLGQPASKVFNGEPIVTVKQQQ